MNRKTHCNATCVHHPSQVVKVLCGVAFLLISHFSPISAQTGGGYDLTWSSIDNGGATAFSPDGYALAGSIGQPDAGVATSTNGYSLSGGFIMLPQYRAYIPIAIRN